MTQPMPPARRGGRETEPQSAQSLVPDFENVQAHYDLSDAFFKTFLDDTMTYSCGFFPRGDETLKEAQLAKIDLALGKLQLVPGQRLLDIGCGWGHTALRARQEHGVRVVGLTLSENQFAYASNIARQWDGLEFRLEGWETHEGKYDRIVSIGAFEHFGLAKYPVFFSKARELLGDNGLMLLHTIHIGKPSRSLEFARYLRGFLGKVIFPGGYLPTLEQILTHSAESGFELIHEESLGSHYAITLNHWADNLEHNREAAIAATDEEIYDTYLNPYLKDTANWFRSGELDVSQFLFRAVPQKQNSPPPEQLLN